MFLVHMFQKIVVKLFGAFFDRYIFVENLGAGACAEVKKMYDRIGRKCLAFKYVSNESVNADYEEVEILQKLCGKHEVFLELHSVEKTAGVTTIVTEVCPGQQLFSLIISNSLPLRQIKIIFKKVLEGLAIAHKEGIIHRDIKPENIMVELKDFQVSSVKLIDWGMSITHKLPKTMAGSLVYASPEILNQSGEKCVVGPWNDIWGFGITLYQTLARKSPYPDTLSNEDLYNFISEFPIIHMDDVFDEDAKDLLELVFMPYECRPSARELLQHRWFVGV